MYISTVTVYHNIRRSHIEHIKFPWILYNRIPASNKGKIDQIKR